MPTPHEPTLIETHLSRVWLRADDVLKVQKPARYAFVDHGSIEARRASCEAEVAHNSPWAPGVYRGVVDVEGQPPHRVGSGDGEPAVWMHRLPADATLESRLRAGGIAGTDIAAIGAFLRARHDAAALRPDAAQPEVVEARIRENLDELSAEASARDPSLSPLLAHAADGLQLALGRAANDLRARADRGRLLHGDLRCEHIYLPNGGFAALDGVAFSDRLASGDPIEDVAFLAMDLACGQGRWDLVPSLWEGWGWAPEPLRALYSGHRSLIRAKVALLSGAPMRARRHVLYALYRWQEPRSRPMLVGVGGLPGVGKSTLARGLAAELGLEVLRTDVLRRELPGPPDYSDTGRRRVYQHLLSVARGRVAAGGRVLVDASFGRRAWREAFRAVARELGLPAPLCLVNAPASEALERIEGRTGDASEADAAVYRSAASSWEPVSEREQGRTFVISSSGPRAATLVAALAALR